MRKHKDVTKIAKSKEIQYLHYRTLLNVRAPINIFSVYIIWYLNNRKCPYIWVTFCSDIEVIFPTLMLLSGDTRVRFHTVLPLTYQSAQKFQFHFCCTSCSLAFYSLFQIQQQSLMFRNVFFSDWRRMS